MHPVILLEINDNAMRAQSTSAEALLAILRCKFDYDIMVFSVTTVSSISKLTSNEKTATFTLPLRARLSFLGGLASNCHLRVLFP